MKTKMLMHDLITMIAGLLRFLSDFPTLITRLQMFLNEIPTLITRFVDGSQ